ncbi:MAG: imelysin family protein [Burkholderiaceae bacterium]
MSSKPWMPAVLLAASFGLTACGGGGSDAPAVQSDNAFAAKSLITNVVDNVITATYVELDNRADALLAAVQALQTGGATEPELDAAQAAWRATRVPWETSEGFLFGPVDSLGIDPAIDSWPLNTPDLQAFLAANPTATQGDIENAGDDLRGFHAIELLLFGDGVADNDRDAADLTAPELSYLVALAQAFAARTGQLAAAWTTDFNGAGPYATLVKTAGASGNTTYVSGAAVLEELVNAVAGIADEVANAKIAEPFADSAANADTSLVESQYSWNSLTDFHNNIQSILNVYTGQRGFDPDADTVSTASPGLYSFVAFSNQTLADRVLGEIIAAQRRVALIKGDGNVRSTEITGIAKPFREQIGDATGRTLISEAIAAISTLQTSLAQDVLPLVSATTITNTPAN